jgi:glycerol uptake facilitator protein
VSHAILPIGDKRNSDWGYAFVPIVGPLIASGIGAEIIMLAGLR